MFRQSAPFVCLALLVGSCEDNMSQNNYAGYQSVVEKKPLVALLPLIDNTKHGLSWDISEELTSSVHHRLLLKDKLYLVDKEKVLSATKKLKESDNPFVNDLSWMKRSFPSDEFVVFLELIEHDEVPVYSTRQAAPGEVDADLQMSVRVRVVDLRGEQPKIVLQELIHESHRIPKQFTKANFHQVPWDDDSFSISPVGLAHDALSKEIAVRVQDYILLSTRK